MKKLLMLLQMLLLLSVVSCGSDDKDEPSSGGDNGDGGGDKHEWVDLGLPSGTLWATMNVGATTPQGFGDYFAWGETTTKEIYQWSTYKWCNGDRKSITKYCSNSQNGIVDNKKELDPEDDAAYVNWGPKWRTPTEEQFNELLKMCDWEMSSAGVLFKSKTNSNTLFLPTAGYRSGSSLEDNGKYGNYMTRFHNNDIFALGLDFHSGFMRVGNWLHRSVGQSVRAVRVAE